MHRNNQHPDPALILQLQGQAEAQARQAAIADMLTDTHRRIYIDQLRQQDLINCVSEEQQVEICQVAAKFAGLATRIFGLEIGILKQKE